MAQSTIQQRISLSGAEEIKRQLQDLGAAGEKAINQISDASARARFSGFGEGIASVKQSFAQLGQTLAPIRTQLQTVGDRFDTLRDRSVRAAQQLGIGVAAGLGVATVGILKFVKDSATAADDIGDAAEGLGLGVQAYQELAGAAAKVGVEHERFARGFASFANQLATQAGKEQDATIKLAQTVVGETQRAGTAILNFNRDSTSKLVGGIQDYLKAARDAAPAIQKALAAQGVVKSVDEIAFSLASAASQAGKAGESVRALFAQFGQQVPGLTIFENLGQNLDEVNKVFERLGVRTRNAAGEVKKADEIFGDLADRFAALPEGAQKTADAIALFGQRVGPRLIPLLNRGREGVQALRQEFADLGIAITDEQSKIGEKFVFALSNLQSAFKGVRTQVGLLFAELVTPVIEAISEAFLRNAGAIRTWASDIRDRARPAIDDLIKLLRGAADSEIDTKWLLDVRDAVIALRDGIVGAIPVIKSAFNALKAVLDTAAKAINAIFGTDLSSAGLAVILVIGQLTGVLPALTSALTLAASAAGLLLVAFTSLSSPVLIVAGFVALTAAIIAFRGDIDKAGTAVVDFISNFLGISTKASHEGAALKAFGGMLGQTFSDAGQKVDELKDKALQIPTVLRGIAEKTKASGIREVLSQTTQTPATRAPTSLPITGKIVDITDSGVPEARSQIEELKRAWTDLAIWFDNWKRGFKQSVANAFSFQIVSAESFNGIGAAIMRAVDDAKTSLDNFVSFIGGEFAGAVASALDAIGFDTFRQNVVSAADAARQAFELFLGGLSVGSAFDALSGASNAFWSQLSSDAQTVTGTVGVLFTGLQTTITGIFTGLGLTLSNFWLSLQIGAQTALSFVGTSWALLQIGVDQTIAAITSSFTGLWSSITDGFLGAINAVSDAFSSLSSKVSSVASSILSTLQPVFDFVTRIANSLFGLQGSAGGLVGVGGFAGGGRVSGGRPGVDSVPALLMPDEFVIRVAAVRKYGADLFRALNSMRVPAELVRPRGFDLGGLVQSVIRIRPPSLRFAVGGMVPAVAGAGSAQTLAPATATVLPQTPTPLPHEIADVPVIDRGLLGADQKLIGSIKQAWADFDVWWTGFQEKIRRPFVVTLTEVPNSASEFSFESFKPKIVLAVSDVNFESFQQGIIRGLDGSRAGLDGFLSFIAGGFGSRIKAALNAPGFEEFRQNAQAGLAGARQALDGFLAGLADGSAFDALSSAASAFWSALTSDARAATGAVGALFTGLQTTIGGVFTGRGATVQTAAALTTTATSEPRPNRGVIHVVSDAFAGLGARAGGFDSRSKLAVSAIGFEDFRQNALAGLDGARQALDGFLATLSADSAFDALSGTASAFWHGLISDAQRITGAIGPLFTDLRATISDAFTARGVTRLSVQTALTSEPWSGLGPINVFAGIGSKMSSVASTILTTLQPVFDFVTKIATFLFGLSAGGSTGAAVSGFAAGGRVQGGRPGIDSVPAMLMPEEFVIRVAAVRKYGADLFHALNSMRVPVELVRPRGFDLGGLVQSVIGAQQPPLQFAAGGMVPAVAGGGSSGGTLNLTIDGTTFEGLKAPTKVYNDLVKFARGKATRSTGRKPGWFGSAPA